jgi:hypothetical protein
VQGALSELEWGERQGTNLPGIFMEMLLDMVNQNVQETLKKSQYNKNKEYEKKDTKVN